MLLINVFTSGLQWTGCINVCREADIDDRRSERFHSESAETTSMTGEVRGFIVKVLKVNPEIRLDHCLLNREALLPRLRLVF
jgi:hypothetical protein